jgi:hypothetical protein
VPFITRPWNVSNTLPQCPDTDELETRHQDRSHIKASMVSRMLEESYKLEDKEKVALEAASNAYIAGVGWFWFLVVHDTRSLTSTAQIRLVDIDSTLFTPRKLMRSSHRHMRLSVTSWPP